MLFVFDYVCGLVSGFVVLVVVFFLIWGGFVIIVLVMYFVIDWLIV